MRREMAGEMRSVSLEWPKEGASDVWGRREEPHRSPYFRLHAPRVHCLMDFPERVSIFVALCNLRLKHDSFLLMAKSFAAAEYRCVPELPSRDHAIGTPPATGTRELSSFNNVTSSLTLTARLMHGPPQPWVNGDGIALHRTAELLGRERPCSESSPPFHLASPFNRSAEGRV
ncbi:hypothetical protein CEXT_396401 [Caerostris extrusa]|uniref:Uncharacterized protein n=1 Tax=Caerostris extrusa TaxID=172846 RepID=A0AAV4Y5M2_CAEEX|nr:hypothetical protein CEXT_396401 [Caerostris extrusa]